MLLSIHWPYAVYHAWCYTGDTVIITCGLKPRVDKHNLKTNIVNNAIREHTQLCVYLPYLTAEWLEMNMIIWGVYLEWCGQVFSRSQRDFNLWNITIHLPFFKKNVNDCIWQCCQLTGRLKERNGALWNSLQTMFLILAHSWTYFRISHIYHSSDVCGRSKEWLDKSDSTFHMLPF